MSPPCKWIATSHRPFPWGALNVGLSSGPRTGEGGSPPPTPGSSGCGSGMKGLPASSACTLLDNLSPAYRLPATPPVRVPVRPWDPSWGLQPEKCLTRHPPRLCNRPSAIPEVLQPGNPLLPGIPTDGFEVATCGRVSWGGVPHLPPGPRSLASGGDASLGPFGAFNLPFPARPIANTPTAEHRVSCFYPARCKPGPDMRIWKAGEISLGLEWGWLG